MSFETERQEGLAHVACNNVACPMNEDDECHCNNPIEIFFHPSQPWPSFACWWDDNKDKEV